jgi:hypothetical protein
MKIGVRTETQTYIAFFRVHMPLLIAYMEQNQFPLGKGQSALFDSAARREIFVGNLSDLAQVKSM